MENFGPVIVGTVVNGVFLGIAIWAIKAMITGFQNAMKETVDSLKQAVHELKTEDKEIWTAVNCHGHKGLEGDDNKVTR
jgi:hypothetical protein